MRKVIQLMTDRDCLYALANDGTMWFTDQVLNEMTTKPDWRQVGNVPQPVAAEPPEPVEAAPKPKPKPPKKPTPELPPAEAKPEVQPEPVQEQVAWADVVNAVAEKPNA